MLHLSKIGTELQCQWHQSCRHNERVAVFGSSDDRVLLTCIQQN